MEFNKHWKEYTNPDFIGAYSFLSEENGKVKATPQKFTITDVAHEEVTGDGGKKDKKIIAYLSGTSKRMIFNATNSKEMISLFGDTAMFPVNWKGKSIVISAVNILERKEWVWRMRIIRKGETEATKRDELAPSHKRWAGAKNALANGTATIEDIKKVFDISAENELLLTPKTTEDETV